MEALQEPNIDLKLLLPLIIISLVLTLIALINCIRTEATNGPKWMWIIIILAVSLFGPIAYFVVGRKNQ